MNGSLIRRERRSDTFRAIVGDSWHGEAESTAPMPPGWVPKVLMAVELPRLERELNGVMRET